MGIFCRLFLFPIIVAIKTMGKKSLFKNVHSFLKKVQNCDFRKSKISARNFYYISYVWLLESSISFSTDKKVTEFMIYHQTKTDLWTGQSFIPSKSNAWKHL